MATGQCEQADWVMVLGEGIHRHLSEEEKARRRAETKRLLAARDNRPSIAPDTTGEYIRQVRDEEDVRL